MKKLFGEQYRRLVVIILAVLSIFIAEYFPINQVTVALTLLSLSVVYSIYVITKNVNLTKKKKVVNSIVTFMSTSLIFMFVLISAESFLGFDKRPPSCKSLETTQLLNEMLIDGIDGYDDTSLYVVDSLSIGEFNKEENTYICNATLKINPKRIEDSSENNPLIKNALQNIMDKFGKKTLDFKVLNSEEKGYFDIKMIN